MASFTEGGNGGTCGWVTWHLRENPSPEASAVFKISIANLHMVKKRRLQDKNMISLSAGGASAPTTQTVDLAAKYPRKKKTTQ